MKKILIVTLMVFGITSALYAENNQSFWSKAISYTQTKVDIAKQKAKEVSLETKKAYGEFNSTKAWENTKQTAKKVKQVAVSGVNAVEESWDDDKTELGYAETLNEVWEKDNVPVENLTDEEYDYVVDKYEQILTEAVRLAEATENRLIYLHNKRYEEEEK